MRTLGKQAWARYSKRKPKKSFVKAMPHLSLLNYHMGDGKKDYDTQFDICTNTDIQLRDNALEASRQSSNKVLEKAIPNQYEFVVRVYPHNVIRENKMIAGAGADRLQKGMRKAYGRPTDRAARMRVGQAAFTIKTNAVNKPHVLEAFRRAKAKLSGHWSLVEKSIKPKAS
ncbi:MAG: 50S ribosomal protein L16 [Candidatus Micrarchaeota archaeon]|nr:50S ribosomal protein L16 [Candidatus Micrarchaeota archaeon]